MQQLENLFLVCVLHFLVFGCLLARPETNPPIVEYEIKNIGVTCHREKYYVSCLNVQELEIDILESKNGTNLCGNHTLLKGLCNINRKPGSTSLSAFSGVPCRPSFMSMFGVCKESV